MHVLSYGHEDNCHACVLTDRDSFFSCYSHIVKDISKDVLSHWGLLFLGVALYTAFHILRKIQIGFYAQISYKFFYF